MNASFRGANAGVFANGPSYRFGRHYDRQGKPKAYTNSYRVLDADGVAVFTCDMTGYGQGTETVFRAGESGPAAFRLCPGRKLMGFDYTAVDAAGGTIGQIRTQAGLTGRYCSLHAADGGARAVLIDPAPWTERYIGPAFGHVAGAYLFVADPAARDRSPLASLTRAPGRNGAADDGLRGLMQRLLADADWLLRLTLAAADRLDHRLAIGACLLHQENHVPADRSS